LRVLITLASIAIILGSTSAALAQAETTTTNETIPIEAFVGDPCTPETVDITGDMHVVTHVTTEANGSFHVSAQLNYQGVSGTGRTTGTTYRLTDAGSTIFNGEGDHDSANEFQNEFTFQMVSSGSADNFRSKVVIHTTVTPNDETTSLVLRFDTDCGG
jgi:hypothetical protein